MKWHPANTWILPVSFWQLAFAVISVLMFPLSLLSTHVSLLTFPIDRIQSSSIWTKTRVYRLWCCNRACWKKNNYSLSSYRFWLNFVYRVFAYSLICLLCTYWLLQLKTLPFWTLLWILSVSMLSGETLSQSPKLKWYLDTACFVQTIVQFSKWMKHMKGKSNKSLNVWSWNHQMFLH